MKVTDSESAGRAVATRRCITASVLPAAGWKCTSKFSAATRTRWAVRFSQFTRPDWWSTNEPTAVAVATAVSEKSSTSQSSYAAPVQSGYC